VNDDGQNALQKCERGRDGAMIASFAVPFVFVLLVVHLLDLLFWPLHYAPFWVLKFAGDHQWHGAFSLLSFLAVCLSELWILVWLLVTLPRWATGVCGALYFAFVMGFACLSTWELDLIWTATIAALAGGVGAAFVLDLSDRAYRAYSGL
jgi:hypothetical protein